MSSIVALDVGSKRVGTARTPVDQFIPVAGATFLRADGEAPLIQYLKECQAALLVIGIPLAADGSETQASSAVRTFARRIQKRHPIAIEFVDEFLTTESTKEFATKETKDALAALDILRSWGTARGKQ